MNPIPNAPLRMQLSTLKAQIASLRAREVALEKEEISLIAALSSIMAQRRDTKAAIASLERSLSSVSMNWLPRNVLREIFRHTLLPHTRTVNRRKVSMAPWRLSHVSQYWRETAREDAHLWSHVVIDCRRQQDPAQGKDRWLICKNPTIEYPRAALETQILLSQNAPLSIEFYVDPQGAPDLYDLPGYLDILVSQSRRWVKFTLGGRSDTSLWRGLVHAAGHLDQLRFLHVTEWNNKWPAPLVNLFAVAPQLREVLLPHTLELNHHLARINLPWHQLIRLQVCTQAALAPEILGEADNLADLTYHRLDGPTDRQDLTILPSLRRLSLCDTWVGQYLSAPELNRLELTYHVEHIASFVHYSRCHLQSLRLSSISAGPAAVIAVLQQTPYLTHLQVADHYRSYWEYTPLLEGLITAFTIPTIANGNAAPNNNNICMKLRELEFSSLPRESAYPGREFWELLCTMLESRWFGVPTAGRALRCFRKPSVEHDKAIQKRFEALANAGLELLEPE
ncbi:hypothetical protein R3P38DRAFT_325327 [Favolaschia claudopus]|uniref:F-box domain-containing protein n=1 Tax=Favolaschia claudopus TaxID=2862362 RepID=A0AAW0CW45_9AGAR